MEGDDDEDGVSVDSELSISIKMAPGPEHRQESLTTDKNTDNRVVQITNESNGDGNVIVDVLNNSSTESADGISNPQSIPVHSLADKQVRLGCHVCNILRIFI